MVSCTSAESRDRRPRMTGCSGDWHCAVVMTYEGQRGENTVFLPSWADLAALDLKILAPTVLSVTYNSPHCEYASMVKLKKNQRWTVILCLKRTATAGHLVVIKDYFCFDKQHDYQGRLMDRKSTLVLNIYPGASKMSLGDSKSCVIITVYRGHWFESSFSGRNTCTAFATVWFFEKEEQWRCRLIVVNSLLQNFALDIYSKI